MLIDEIKYPYPVAGVEDLEVRLMLAGVAVSDWVPMAAYEIRDLHAGYEASFEDVEADAVEIFSESEGIADERALPTIVDVDFTPILDAVEQTETKVDYIYDLYHTLPPDRPPLPPASDPSTPGMVTLRVVLRDGTTLRPNEQVTVAMLEKGNVSIDGAHEVDKTYPGTTNQYGIADIPVFASTRLAEKGYNGLYSVVAPGVRRNVWVPANGGVLDDLPKSKPTS